MSAPEQNGRAGYAHLDRFFARPSMFEALSHLISRLGLENTAGSTIVGLTSASRGEGVTTIALYLARRIADTFHAPTLALEVDFRRPSMARYCQLPPGPGLRDYLDGTVDDVGSCIHAVPGSLVHLLPAGGHHTNPLRLVVSDRFAAFLDEARRDYRFVVADLPAAVTCTEAVPVLRAADRRVLVVRAGATLRRDVVKSAHWMTEQGVPLDGTILNRRRRLLG